MKQLATYHSLGLTSEDEVFSFLMETFHANLREWDYFVNWDKAFRNTERHTSQMVLWDSLIGSQTFDQSFRDLFKSHPSLSMTIPYLVVRDGSESSAFSIVTEAADWRAGLRNFDFSTPAVTDSQIDAALEFVTKTGLKRLFEEERISSARDFLLGAEAGLDSNARKNRGGNAMTTIVNRLLSQLVEEKAGELLAEAYAKDMEAAWGVDLSSVSPNRRFDFAVKLGEKILVIEINAYGGGGSKLKSTASEYQGLQEELRDSPVTFVWITEGAGWQTTRIPLRKAFGTIDHILNLRLVEEGALEEIIWPNEPQAGSQTES